MKSKPNKMLLFLALIAGFLLLFLPYGFLVATHPPRIITSLTPHDLEEGIHGSLPAHLQQEYEKKDN